MVGEQDAMKTTPARARTARDERHDGAHLDRNGSNIWTLYRAWWPETSAACSCLVPVWCSFHLSILCSPCVVDLAGGAPYRIGARFYTCRSTCSV